MRILRNLIIISVLLVSVTVQASGVDELVRIKQNYARMLVPSGKDPFGLLSILRLFSRKQRFRIRLW